MFTTIFSTFLLITQMSSIEKSPDCELRFTCDDGAPLAEVMSQSFMDIQEQLLKTYELIIQAANGAIGNRERGFLNDEVQARLAEVGRILKQTSYQDIFGEIYNPYNTGLDFLLSYASNVSKKNLVSKFHFPQLSLENFGVVARHPVQIAEPNRIARGPALKLNGVEISRPGKFDDSVSTVEGWNSAIAWSRRINAQSGSSGVQATVFETIVTLPLDYDFFPLTNSQININGVTILQGHAHLDSPSALIDFMNEFSGSTGVRARHTPFNIMQLELYADDGRNIAIDLMKQENLAGLFSNTIPADQMSVHYGQIELISQAAFKIEDLIGVFADEALKNATLETTENLYRVDVTTLAGAQNSLQLIDSALTRLWGIAFEINKLMLYCQD